MITGMTQAHQHGLIEIRFESGVGYANPFKDVQLEASFKSPGGRCLVVPAFWAGDNRWHVRYSSPEVGVHQFETRCSDESNEGLHLRSGVIEVLPYHGDNPLFTHGGVKIADDLRRFSHADGTPFFWLGDTWWMALSKRLSWPEGFQTLVQNRKSLGFNLVQLVAGLYPDMSLFDERGMAESGFSWRPDLSQVNPCFFDEADLKVVHLVEQGLVPCIVGAWGYYLPMIGLDNMKLHWRYLMARWGALPVVWVAAGEQTLPWYLEGVAQKSGSREQLKQDWSLVIGYMRSINGFGRLITTHPVVSARESVVDAKLLDFEMQQTNHALPTAHHAARAQEGWNGQPLMPVISAESRYEGLELKPVVTARDAREAFWAHTLNSGVAGHTYGANGIWQVNTRQEPFGTSASGLCWGNTSWDEAMLLPAARQIGLARAFLESLPRTRLVPQPIPVSRMEKFMVRKPRLRRVLQALGWRPVAPTPMAVCVTDDRSCVIAYTTTGRAFKLDVVPLQTPVTATWIDPTNFAQHPIRLGTDSASWQFRPDRKNAAGDTDWLLCLQVNG